MSDIRAVLAGAVKDYLREAGFKQADLARASGLTEKHISQMLTGAADGSFTAWSVLLSACGLTVTCGEVQRELCCLAGQGAPAVEQISAKCSGCESRRFAARASGEAL